MLSKLIVSSYNMFIEVSLWLSLLMLVVGGWIGASSADASGILGAIIGAIIWFVVAVVFFGAFLILGDIRDRVKKIEESK